MVHSSARVSIPALLCSSLLAVLAGCGPDLPAEGEGEPPDLAKQLSGGLEADALLAHLQALQTLADENLEQPGVRPPAATRTWARAVLENAGYVVEEQAFSSEPRVGCGAPCAGSNMVATWPEQPTGLALLVGGHIDVVGGPGTNDNGTGVASVVEIAVQAASLGIAAKVPLRFVLFDREESGLLGSHAYLSGLDFLQNNEEPPPGPVLQELLGVVIIDMTGSPNGVPAFNPVPDPPDGSASLEDAAQEYFSEDGRTMAELPPLTARSDHWPFMKAGLPGVWMFAGADGLKTQDEAARYGGTAGEPYAPCYHAACDNLDNVNLDLATDLARSAAWTVGRLGGRDGLLESQ
jgi:aminopeptidase S